MSRSRRSVPLAFTRLEDRLTPAFVAASVAQYIRDARIVASSNPDAVGAVYSNWEPNAGPSDDPQQRVVDPREAGLAVRGLLLSAGNDSPAGDNLKTAQNYVRWYLRNALAVNEFVLDQQWYRPDGSRARETPTASEATATATFLQVAWDYARLGGDRAVFNEADYRGKVIGLVDSLVQRNRQDDGLYVANPGDTTESLADNSEVYAGLVSAGRLLADVYADAAHAASYDTEAVRLRTNIRLQFYAGAAGGYGWVKDVNGNPDIADDATNPWVTRAVRLYPAAFGVDDPRGTRSTGELASVNAKFAGGRDWVNHIDVDQGREPWTVVGYAQNAVSGDTTRGSQHNDYIYDLTFGGRSTRPVTPNNVPVTTADAGWMLRAGGPFDLAPVAAAQSLTLAQNDSVPVTLAGSDPDGPTPLRFTVVSGPAHGTFIGTDPLRTYTTNTAFTYAPTPGYSGDDAVVFKVSDGVLDSDTVTVKFFVNAAPADPGTGPGGPGGPGLPPVSLPPTVPGVPGVPGVPVVPGVPPLLPPLPVPPLTAAATLVTGPATGGAVTVVTETGAIRSVVFPLDAATPGGAHAALADLDRDGTPDYVAGSGPGGPSAVVALSGRTEATLFRLAPFEPSFTGGVFVAAADLNGDGVPDIAVSADQGGGPRVRIFDGKTRTPLVDFFGIDDRAFRGGARVAFGDVTGDGTPDLIVAAGFGGGPRVTVWDGKSLLAGVPRPVANFFAFEPGLRNGVYVAAGEFTGDRKADLVAGAGPGGGPRVSVFSGSLLAQSAPPRYADFFVGDPSARGGVSVAAKPGANGTSTLVTGDGPSATVGRLRAYSTAALAANPTAPATAFDVEPLDGSTAGIYVG